MMQTVVFVGGPRDGEMEEVEFPDYMRLVPIFGDTHNVNIAVDRDPAGDFMSDIYCVRYIRAATDDHGRPVYVYEHNERWECSRLPDTPFQSLEELLESIRETFGEGVAVLDPFDASQAPTGEGADSFTMRFDAQKEGKSQPSAADLEIEEWNKILHPERYNK